jgi:hypothetical protein
VGELQPGDPSRIGPYRLVEVLGAGGMGRVYLGRSAGGRLVAVKVIRAEFAADPEFRARFRREVELARRVHGFYTALVVDADVDGEVPWLATAYVAAPSLAQAVARSGPLAAGALSSLAAGLAEGLGAIHAAGLVHRDLKPSNVLLADDGPRVIDFGISRAAEATVLTAAGEFVGSPGYTSPEQAAGRETGPASDIFSLGAVVCFAATGRGAFGRGSMEDLVYRIVHGAPDLDGVPAGIRPLVERCLAKAPADRPTAAEILAELAEPGLADPEPAGAQLAGPEHGDRGLGDPERGGAESGTTTGSAYPPTETAGNVWDPPHADTVIAASAARRARRWSRRKAGLAAAAAAVIAAAAIAIPLALTSGPSYSWTRQAGITELRVGDCLTQGTNQGTLFPHNTFTVVPCNEEHGLEVFFAQIDFWSAPAQYPGDFELGNQAMNKCFAEFKSYVGGDFTDGDNVTTGIPEYPLAGNPWSWESGSRFLVCAGALANMNPAHQSIRNSRG